MDVEGAWNSEKMPWKDFNVDVKGEMLKNRINTRSRLRSKELNKLIFKKRLKTVDPNEKEQKFIDTCMKIDDKDNIENYKVIFNDIFKGEINDEKINFFYDIISQYDTKIKKINFSKFFDFSDINVYLYNTGDNSMFISTDNLYWQSLFCSCVSNYIKDWDEEYLSFWNDSSLYDKLDNVRVVSEVISLNMKYEYGYFHDYSKYYYLGDILCLGISKEEFGKMLNDGKYSWFMYNGAKYRFYTFNLSKVKDIKSEYKKWETCRFIYLENDEIFKKCLDSFSESIYFFSEKSNEINEMKEGLKLIKINNSVGYYYFNSKIKPVDFCPSCIKFNNIVKYDVLYKCKIDYDFFFSRCLELGYISFPVKSIFFNNLESIFNIGIIFLFVCKIKKKSNDEYLNKLRDILIIYSNNRNIFEISSNIYNKFKKIVLEYIDGLSGHFYYSRYVKLYEQSNQLMLEYKKMMVYYYEGSDVLKFLNFWKGSTLLIRNFLESRIMDVIVGINNVCYQIVNFLSKDAALYLRTAGVLCYSVLFDGDLCCVDDIRPHCIFMGGLENTKNKKDIFDKIAYLVDVKKYKEDILKKSEYNDFKRIEYVLNVVSDRYANAIRRLIESNKYKNVTINDIDKIISYFKTIDVINNFIVNETNEILKDKYIKRLEETTNIVSNYELDKNIDQAIVNVLSILDEKYENINDIDNIDSELYGDLYGAIYDQIEAINKKNMDDVNANGVIRKGEINKIIDTIKNMDFNELNDVKKKNLSKRVRKKFKFIKK